MPRAYHTPVEQRNNRERIVPQTVLQYPNDPRIFIFVMGEWYCFNPCEKPIGSGAMGIVYHGYSCMNNRLVAIKEIRYPYYNNPQIRERARDEASLAFRHQNLIEMLGCCEYSPGSGPIFLVSNFVQGQDIDKYVLTLENSPMREEKICLAICSVLDALDFVHAHNLVHRDVKPSNIMVENNSNIRLMDLGIAKINEGNSYSRFGFIGTPEYSAPEQIKGDRDKINKTTDIYELGITFYELLTGENPMACASEAETLTKQMMEPLPPNKRITKKLFKVILKATEKDQQNRYQTAMQFKAAIQEAIMPSPSLLSRIQLWISNHIIGFMGIIMLLGIIFLAITMIFRNIWN